MTRLETKTITPYLRDPANYPPASSQVPQRRRLLPADVDTLRMVLGIAPEMFLDDEAVIFTPGDKGQENRDRVAKELVKLVVAKKLDPRIQVATEEVIPIVGGRSEKEQLPCILFYGHGAPDHFHEQIEQLLEEIISPTADFA